MTYLPRPGHSPTDPTTHDPLSDLVGFLAVVGQAASAGLAALGPLGTAVIGIAVSRNISMKVVSHDAA
jgi:hypothetical protein